MLSAYIIAAFLTAAQDTWAKFNLVDTECQTTT